MTIADVIGAIGEPEFPAVAAGSMRRAAGFDLAAILIHGRGGRPDILFDNFDTAGRRGLESYARITHRINPMPALARGVVRARDFAASPQIAGPMTAYVEPASDEELGYRTLGWPQRLEEIGLYFEGCGGVVEIGLYRERTGSHAADGALQALGELVAPVAAAFERHHRFAVRQPPAGRLSRREQEICELVLAGCSTEAIALRLQISAYTVKDHRKRIFRKLGAGSLQELFALSRTGWNSPALEG
jgi:DNA-binding CsgD family transcriptional regulator